MDLSKTSTGPWGGRPMVMGTQCVISTGHTLATEAGMEILRRGGNAADAAVTAGFALSVLKPHQNGIAGEVPMLIYTAEEGRVWSVSGAGVAPRAATLDHYHSLGIDMIPGDGFLPLVVPSAVSTYLLVLERFGTLRVADVLAPALALAGRGFPMYDHLHGAIQGVRNRFLSEWPSSAEVFLHGDTPPVPGAIWKQPCWAATFQALIDADRAQADRVAGCKAAADAFYRGAIADRMVSFCTSEPVMDASQEAHTGLLQSEDLAGFEAHLEDSVSTAWQDLEIHKCSSWTQGPVLLQMLNLLKGYDLVAMKHNSVEMIHTVAECMKLAFADREFYYGDPRFTDVPFERLLSDAYAAERRALIDSTRASAELRPGGYAAITPRDVRGVDLEPGAGDTTKFEVIDQAGNMVSGTPSGGWLRSSPVVPGLGFPLNTRGQMFSLTAGHPNCIEPGKRPRQTLTPSLATRQGQPHMVFGSPGGDCQDQWALQFLVNVTVYGMSLQEAVEAPTFWTHHHPNSFYPRGAELASLYVENRVPSEIRNALTDLGHNVTSSPAFSGGNTLAATIDPDTELRCAAASPRLNPAAATGW